MDHPVQQGHTLPHDRRLRGTCGVPQLCPGVAVPWGQRGAGGVWALRLLCLLHHCHMGICGSVW